MYLQPNLPCMDNMAFDMDRMSRSQTSSQRTALVDLSSETSISLEPLRHSSSSQLPSDEELIPRSGEINIAVTSKSGAYYLLFCLSYSKSSYRWSVSFLHHQTVLQTSHTSSLSLLPSVPPSPSFPPQQGVSFPYFSALTASLHLLFRDICVLLRLSSVMSAGVCAPQQCVLPFTAINILY